MVTPKKRIIFAVERIVFPSNDTVTGYFFLCGLLFLLFFKLGNQFRTEGGNEFHHAAVQ